MSLKLYISFLAGFSCWLVWQYGVGGPFWLPDCHTRPQSNLRPGLVRRSAIGPLNCNGAPIFPRLTDIVP